MKKLTLEDIKVLPKEFQTTTHITSDINHLMVVNLLGDVYFSYNGKTIHRKYDVLDWINSKELDRKLFFEAVKKEQFTSEMEEIINDA